MAKGGKIRIYGEMGLKTRYEIGQGLWNGTKEEKDVKFEGIPSLRVACDTMVESSLEVDVVIEAGFERESSPSRGFVLTMSATEENAGWWLTRALGKIGNDQTLFLAGQAIVYMTWPPKEKTRSTCYTWSFEE